MVSGPVLTLQIAAEPDEDLVRLDGLAGSLRMELLELDVEVVEHVTPPEMPDRAKGLGTIAGWLAVRLATTRVLRSVLDKIRDWASRNDRTVEVSIGSDRFKVTGATTEQVDRLIEAWVSGHGAGA